MNNQKRESIKKAFQKFPMEVPLDVVVRSQIWDSMKFLVGLGCFAVVAVLTLLHILAPWKLPWSLESPGHEVAVFVGIPLMILVGLLAKIGWSVAEMVCVLKLMVLEFQRIRLAVTTGDLAQSAMLSEQILIEMEEKVADMAQTGREFAAIAIKIRAGDLVEIAKRAPSAPRRSSVTSKRRSLTSRG